jgi:hypothetical protein
MEIIEPGDILVCRQRTHQGMRVKVLKVLPSGRCRVRTIRGQHYRREHYLSRESLRLFTKERA